MAQVRPLCIKPRYIIILLSWDFFGCLSGRSCDPVAKTDGQSRPEHSGYNLTLLTRTVTSSSWLLDLNLSTWSRPPEHPTVYTESSETQEHSWSIKGRQYCSLMLPFPSPGTLGNSSWLWFLPWTENLELWTFCYLFKKLCCASQESYLLHALYIVVPC